MPAAICFIICFYLFCFATVRVGYKRKRRSEIQVKLRIQNKSLKTTVFESIVADSGHPGTLYLNHATAKTLGLKKTKGSKCLIAVGGKALSVSISIENIIYCFVILKDGSYEEEWSYHPEVCIKVVDHNIMKIGDCCPIYGGPDYMRAATTKGENLLGLTGLEILNLDIDTSAKRLVVTLPNKKHSTKKPARTMWYDTVQKQSFVNKGDVYKRDKSVKRWGLYRNKSKN